MCPLCGGCPLGGPLAKQTQLKVTNARLPLLVGAGKMIAAHFQVLLNLLAVLDFSRPSH